MKIKWVESIRNENATALGKMRQFWSRIVPFGEGEMAQCPVCLEDCIERSPRPDGAICCENQHFVCVKCIGQLAVPTTLCSHACSGIHYSCPMCRADTCLTPMCVMKVMKGSWRKTTACFDSIEDSQKWSYQRGCVQAA